MAVPTRRGGGIPTLTRGRRTNNTKRSRLLILKGWIIHHVRRKPVPQVTKLCRSSASFLIQAEGGIGEIETATPRTKNNQPQTVLPSDSKTVDDPLPPSVADASDLRTIQVLMPRSETNVPVQAERGSVEIQTRGANDNHCQIGLPPDQARAVDDPRPPSEADASGFQTVLAQLPRSDAFVPIEAGGGTVEFQIATPGAQDREDQPHSLVQLPNSSEVGNPPPSYETVASSYQTVEVDWLRPLPPCQYKRTMAPLKSKLSFYEHRNMMSNTK